MKRIITLFKTKTSRILGLILPAALFVTQASAQTWCTASHGRGCDAFGSVRAPITEVTIKKSGKTIYTKNDGCSGTPYFSVKNTKSKAFDLAAGSTYDITLGTGANIRSWGMSAGVWIDLNADGNFNSTNEYFKLNGLVPASGTKTWSFTIPCTGVTAGITRMRVRSDLELVSRPVQGGNGCGVLNYGETEDFFVNITKPSSIAADFVVPSTIYAGTVPKFNNKYKSHVANKWYVDGVIQNPTTMIDMDNWNAGAAGTYDVKLWSMNCFGADSVTKSVTVIDPPAPPVEDFIAKKTVGEIYSDLELFDLSSNGATSWAWVVYDSVQKPEVTYTSTDQNPLINMDQPGKYTVCLVASNAKWGAGQGKCKKSYIEILPFQDFQIGAGPIYVNQKSGRFTDHAGDSDYDGDRGRSSDRFTIEPCGAIEINAEFNMIDLADGNDILRVFDGPDATGKPLHPGAGFVGGSNGNIPKPFTTVKLKATSGAMYIDFQTDNTGESKGFSGSWTTKQGTLTPPVASWATNVSKVYRRVPTDFVSTSTNLQGTVKYTWAVFDGGEVNYYTKDMVHTFLADNKYKVCLTAETCSGITTYCDSVEVVTPNTKTELDFTASSVRPKIGEDVEFDVNADKATDFTWSVFPTSYSVTSPPDRQGNQTLKFNKPGCYTFTLRAWHRDDSANTVATKVRDKYVCVLDVCTPLVSLISSDVGINNVKIDYKGNNILTNASTSGDAAYTNYESPITELTFGGTYDLTVERNTNIDAMSRKVWIDFNIDGDFDDAGEMVMDEATSNTLSFTSKFTVPALKDAFEGTTKMRVGTSYGTGANTPCGLNIVGEFEDYAILLGNDFKCPTITLNGLETIRIEKGSSYTDAGAKAIDPTEGDISANIKTVSDVDPSTTGIYTVEYSVEDASGNPACKPAIRTVIVVVDRTPPTLTLTGSDMTIPVIDKRDCDGSGMNTVGYVEPGYVANDAVDGNLTSSVLTTGMVDATTTGVYVLTYSVQDVQANKVSTTRTVTVTDTKDPVIIKTGSDKVQIGSVFVDQTTACDNYTDLPTIVNIDPSFQVTYGLNGKVNTGLRATYEYTYIAIDAAGNKTTVIRNYEVDDTIAPRIILNTAKTVYHPVGEVYKSADVEVIDNYYDNTNVSLITNGTVDPYTLGTYVETFTATDASGNKTSVTRNVVVEDKEAPRVYGRDLISCREKNVNPLEDIVITDNYYSSAELLKNIKVISQNVNIWVEGTYHYIFSVVDPSGNESAPMHRRITVTADCDKANVSLDDLDINSVLNVYPNPTNGVAKVKYDLPSKVAISVTVTDLMGKTIKTVSNVEGSGVLALDLSNQANGVYLVRINSGNHSTTKRIILNK